MAEIKTCSVFGHREIEVTKKLEEKLFAIFEELIKKGCKIFYFGGYGQFDELCYNVISKLKKIYIDIQRIFCVADPRHLRINKRPFWLKEKDFEDFIELCLQFDWWYTRIYYRNCAMIDISDYVVFYAEEKSTSGAYKALKYAKQKKREIINLF